jgi:hypothetical protein
MQIAIEAVATARATPARGQAKLISEIKRALAALFLRQAKPLPSPASFKIPLAVWRDFIFTGTMTRLQRRTLVDAGHVREREGLREATRGIADELDKQKVPTPRGGSWHPQLVKRIVQRLALQVMK